MHRIIKNKNLTSITLGLGYAGNFTFALSLNLCQIMLPSAYLNKRLSLKYK